MMGRERLHFERRAEHIMGMPAVEGRRWTAAEVRALPDEPGKRFEVVDGELLVSPGPSFAHQRVTLEFQVLLRAYFEKWRVADVLGGPAEIEADPNTLIQPDVFVLPLVNGRRPRDWADVERALLIIEVLSPSTARYDRVKKRRRYQRLGAEYWIVDPGARLVERWTPGDERPEMLDDRVSWHPEGVGEPITIDLLTLFARALDD
jgi:Uma2 family endonuclease